MTNSGGATATSIIEPARAWALTRPAELWHYRDLFYFLLRRDLTVRYKQTAVGVLWAVLQPVTYAVIFSVFLGLLFNRAPSGDIPYPVFLLCGFTVWVYFSQAVGQGALSTLTSAALISKVYFPRVLVPVTAVVLPVADFALGFVVLVITMLLYGLEPNVQILLAPAVFALAVMIALGLSLLLSSLVVRYRDVQLAIPFLLQVTVYASAVLYPLSILPDKEERLLALNPMVGVMETYRWAVLPGAKAPGLLFVVPLLVGVLLSAIGLWYFQRSESEFADVI